MKLSEIELKIYLVEDFEFVFGDLSL